MMYEVWNQLQTTGYVLVDQANIVGLAAEKKKTSELINTNWELSSVET